MQELYYEALRLFSAFLFCSWLHFAPLLFCLDCYLSFFASLLPYLHTVVLSCALLSYNLLPSAAIPCYSLLFSAALFYSLPSAILCPLLFFAILCYSSPASSALDLVTEIGLPLSFPACLPTVGCPTRQ